MAAFPCLEQGHNFGKEYTKDQRVIVSLFCHDFLGDYKQFNSIAAMNSDVLVAGKYGLGVVLMI